jgi:hypothetical protein
VPSRASRRRGPTTSSGFAARVGPQACFSETRSGAVTSSDRAVRRPWTSGGRAQPPRSRARPSRGHESTPHSRRPVRQACRGASVPRRGSAAARDARGGRGGATPATEIGAAAPATSRPCSLVARLVRTRLFGGRPDPGLRAQRADDVCARHRPRCASPPDQQEGPLFGHRSSGPEVRRHARPVPLRPPKPFWHAGKPWLIAPRATEPVRRRTEPGPKYWAMTDHPVRVSHRAATALRAMFRVRAMPAALERRERVAPLSSTPLVATQPGEPT